MTIAFASAEFRRILSHYPAGVCAITAMSAEAPVGMVVGSFTSVSLDPPPVAFFQDRKSTSWPKIEAADRFCVNVLAEYQQDICRALSSKAENKFETVPYRLSSTGQPIVNEIVAWIDCDLHAVHAAGDHFIVSGQVHSLDIEDPHRPLLFFQGGYGQFSTIAKEVL
jgi:3-hydroxy-9,10-secoandrosta-1,3,5(10)-triene-9,17-dione monooxygenase reductase component